LVFLCLFFSPFWLPLPVLVFYNPAFLPHGHTTVCFFFLCSLGLVSHLIFLWLLFLHLSFLVLPTILLRNFISAVIILFSCFVINGQLSTPYTRWFKYDRDCLCVNKSQFVPVIFEPPCIKVEICTLL
jgi:hypothetical protein